MITVGDINSVADTLVAHLRANGVGGTDGVPAFYPNDSVPTTVSDESFIEVNLNGGLSSPLSEYGIGSCSLLLILNVKLCDDGAKNTVRETYLLGRISNAVKTPFQRGRFHFSLDKSNLVYEGKDLYSGYSSQTISINVKIY